MRQRLRTFHVPGDVAMESPQPRVVGEEPDHDVAHSRHRDRVPPHRVRQRPYKVGRVNGLPGLDDGEALGTPPGAQARMRTDAGRGEGRAVPMFTMDENSGGKGGLQVVPLGWAPK